MLRRNLIYTAITRSKQSLILCGEVDALRMGVERADEQIGKRPYAKSFKRPFHLHSQMMTTRKLKMILYPTEEKFMQVNPMIGMENLTPYDFMANG